MQYLTQLLISGLAIGAIYGLIAMGFAPGPHFKSILKDVEDQQLDGALASRDEAADYVRARYGPPPPA